MAVLFSSQAGWKAFCRVVSTWSGPVRWAWAASRRDDGQWRLEHFVARAPASAVPVRWRYADTALVVESLRPGAAVTLVVDEARYADTALVVESLSPRAAAQRLRAGNAAAASALGVPLEFGPTPANVYVNRLSTEEDRVTMHGNLWPELYASVSVEGARQTHGGPLHAPGQRLFASWEAALGELIFERPIGATQGHQQPGGIIRLADQRARLAELDVTGDAVGVAIVSERSDLRGWKLRATWRSQAEDPSWTCADIAPVEPGGSIIDIGAVPYEFNVLLVDDRGKVVDRRGWSTGSVRVADDEQTLPAQIERWRHEGEGARVEFKQTLDRPRTKERFAECVAAFANTTGGVILIGVDDRGEVIGYGAGSTDQITQIIHGMISEPPETEVARVRLNDRPVWVVHVQPSKASARPHVVRGRVLVRAHATNREATPREIREMTAADNVENAVWLLR